MSDLEPVKFGSDQVRAEFKPITPLQRYQGVLERSPFAKNRALEVVAETALKGNWDFTLTQFFDLAREQTPLTIVELPELDLEMRKKSGAGNTEWSEKEFHGYMFVPRGFFEEGTAFTKLVNLQHQFKSLLLRKDDNRSEENLLALLDTDLAFLDFASSCDTDPDDVEHFKKAYSARKVVLLAKMANMKKAA